MLEPKCFNKFKKFCPVLILTLWIALPCFLEKNDLNITKSNRAFPGKRRGERALILAYLDNPIAEVLPRYCLFFSILAKFREKRVVKIGLKKETLGPFPFSENSITSIFQTVFLFSTVLPLVRISAMLDLIWGSKGPKFFQKMVISWLLNQ